MSSCSWPEHCQLSSFLDNIFYSCLRPLQKKTRTKHTQANPVRFLHSDWTITLKCGCESAQGEDEHPIPWDALAKALQPLKCLHLPAEKDWFPRHLLVWLWLLWGCWSDFWQYQKGSKWFIPFIALWMWIVGAVKKAEVGSTTSHVLSVSAVLLRGPGHFLQPFPTLTEGKRVTEPGFPLLEGKKPMEKWFSSGQDKDKLSLPEFPVNLEWKGWTFLKIFPLVLFPCVLKWGDKAANQTGRSHILTVWKCVPLRWLMSSLHCLCP